MADRLSPLRYLNRTYTRQRENAREALKLSTSVPPPLAVRSDAPQAISNGLRGYAELSRNGCLARILDQIGPLRARCLQLGFEPGHAPLERVQVPFLGRRQVLSRSRHTLSLAPLVPPSMRLMERTARNGVGLIDQGRPPREAAARRRYDAASPAVPHRDPRLTARVGRSAPGPKGELPKPAGAGSSRYRRKRRAGPQGRRAPE